MELITLSAKARQEEAKERLVLAAFVGWQTGARIKREGESGSEAYPFAEHLARLGLSEQPAQNVAPKANDDTLTLSRMGIKVKKVKET